MSTCNRAEIYAACGRDLEAARDAIIGFLCDFHEVRREELTPHVYEVADADVARHLFRVAAGLDSLVVGEPQILGQVKDAYASAVDAQSVGPALNRLFHAAFAAAKRVRTDTGLAEGAVSVGWAAVCLARKLFGRLAEQRALVVGYGEMGKLTARHLRAQGVTQVMIAGRTAARAAELAGAVQATAIPWEHLPSALGHSDIVITATGSSSPILSRAQIEAAMRGQPTRPLLLIDIAVPVMWTRQPRELRGSRSTTWTTCRTSSGKPWFGAPPRWPAPRQSSPRRRSASRRGFAPGGQSRRWLPCATKFEAIRRTELKRLQPKLAGLPDDARTRVEGITRLIVEKLLLAPTEQLKSVRVLPPSTRIRTP